MSPVRADLLACPRCKAPLSSRGEGFLCEGCGVSYPVEGGVVLLSGSVPEAKTEATVAQFGASWTAFDHMEGYHEAQFRDWIAPLSPESFRGRVVLEAGCGKGRHTRAVASWGAEAVFAVDLSEAVYIAARHNADRPEATFVRANLLELPFGPDTFDVAFCVGVLHHLEDPQGGLAELWRVLKPGGTVALWVYGREGNGWIVHLVDPIRKGITSRIPVPILKWLARPLSFFLFLVLKAIYGPATGWGTRWVPRLPYSAYLGKISRFPFREVDNIVLDHLCPPIAFYLRKETLEGWFASLGASEVRLRWHNRNSWTAIARKPG